MCMYVYVLTIERFHYFLDLYVAKSLSFNESVFVTGSPKHPTILWNSAFPVLPYSLLRIRCNHFCYFCSIFSVIGYKNYRFLVPSRRMERSVQNDNFPLPIFSFNSTILSFQYM